MHPFPTRITLFLGASLALLAFASCGGGEDAGLGPPPPDPVTLDITLGAAQGGPGDLVTISGIPPELEGLYAEVRPLGLLRAAADSSGVAFLLRGDPDRLVLPVHPIAPMAGGEVEIRLTDGERVDSNPITVELEALEAAPGEYAALVGDLQLLLDGWLAQLGTDRETLRSTPVAQLPLPDITLLFVHNLLDNPDNPQSLRRLADGELAQVGGDPVDLELLDAVSARSNLRAWVQEQVALVDTLAAPELPGPPPTLANASRGKHSINCIDPPDFGIGAEDCAMLAEVMRYQTQLELARTSAVEKFEDDLIAAALGVMGYTGAAAVGTGLGATFWAVDTIEDGHHGMYPSEFIGAATDFELSVEEFPEDFTSPGRWSEFRVSAISEGWRFDDKIKEAVEKMAGLRKGLDAPNGLATVEEITAKVEGQIKDGVNAELKGALVPEPEAKLEYCPRTWPGIDCTGLPYSAGSSNSLVYDSAEQSYEPVDVGQATLLVETLPIFGPGKLTGETKQVETKRLEVFVDPFQATMDVTRDGSFTARVDGAEDQSVEWALAGAQLTSSSTANPATLTTPDLPWESPILLTAKSKSNTGLREGKVDSDPRTKTVEIRYGGEVAIYVDPPFACISPGETQQFTPTVVGLENYELLWKKVEGYGSISQSGLYSSLPEGTSSARISVEVVGEPDVIAYADVEVQACNCHYSIMITGAGSMIKEGADIIYQLLTIDGMLFYQFYLEFGSDGSDGGVSMSIADTEHTLAPRIGDTGLFRVNLSFFKNGESWSSHQEDDKSAVHVYVEELTATHMLGRFTGTAVKLDDEGEVESSVVVDIPFRAGYWDGVSGGSWPCN